MTLNDIKDTTGLLRPLLSFMSFFILSTAAAQATEDADTSVTALHEVVVTAVKAPSEVIPAQRLSGKALSRLNSNSVADALRHFAGVQIKDYGGVGGVKTVNVRSMGSHHTGVAYDGIELGNAQNGQIDLGQFSLDNVEEISLHNGQKSGILQPAKDYGAAASVYIRTRTPRFEGGRRLRLRALFRTGSFDLVNPELLAEAKLSETVQASLSAGWTHSSGRYRFGLQHKRPDGSIAWDTTAVRRNGDIDALRGELNISGQSGQGRWHAKAYHYRSERGIPGAIVNNVWRRGERQWDRNTFAQGSYTLTAGRWSLLANAKYAYYDTRYVNNDSRQQPIDNRYRQHEAYASAATELTLTRAWRVSAAADMQYNTMWSDLFGFRRPDRLTGYVSAAASLTLPRLKAQACALGTFIDDRREGVRRQGRQAFSPSVFISGRPLRSRKFSLRAFFKQSFRMPTFNDLYYADMGNSALDPERVTQYNFGAVYEHSSTGVLAAVRVSADAYINRVRDKIVAYPRGQQFRWTMLNLGRVDIRGTDITATATLRPCGGLELTARGQYTYQRAIDITSPSDSYYRDQIPYVPRHSGSATLSAEWRRWAFNLTYMCVGERYNQPENTRANYMPLWQTADASLSRDFTFGKVAARAMIEVNNLAGSDYAVILNYPMPRRNWRLTLRVEI